MSFESRNGTTIRKGSKFTLVLQFHELTQWEILRNFIHTQRSSTSIPRIMLHENPGTVKAASIADILYDEKEELLLVSYTNGKVEEFYGVIKEMYDEFRMSFFREKYFNDHIKNVYDYYFVRA